MSSNLYERGQSRLITDLLDVQRSRGQTLSALNSQERLKNSERIIIQPKIPETGNHAEGARKKPSAQTVPKLKNTQFKNDSREESKSNQVPVGGNKGEMAELMEKGRSLFIEKDQPENALKFFKMALDLLDSDSDFTSIVLHYNVSACYWRLNMLHDCQEYLEKVVQLLSTKVQAL